MAGLSGHTSGTAVTAVTISTTVLAALSVLTRLYTRIRIVKEPGLDDAFITFAILFSIATTITMCLQVKYGMGQHMDTLSPNTIIKNFRAFYVSIWVYNLAMACTKLSILLQYLRIFPQRVFRFVCYVLICIIAIYTCWTFFSAVFACWPIPSFWNPEKYPSGHCLDRFAVWFANAGINIATDIAIGVLPLPVLKELQLPKRQKIALMVVFGLGGCTCVISILRLQSLYVISKATDITWQNPLAAIWSSVEINTGIICSCLPIFRGLVVRVFPRIFGTTRRSSDQAKNKLSEASDGTASSDRAQQPRGFQARKSLEALGRNLAGMGESTFKSYINSRTDTNSDDIELNDAGSWTNIDNRSIHVVTVVEQDVEHLDQPSADEMSTS